MTDHRSTEPTTLAKPPGRRTLLSITAMPTSRIQLTPEFVQAIRDVAPRPRRRLVPYALVVSFVAVLAAVGVASRAPHAWASLRTLARGSKATTAVDARSSEPLPIVVAVPSAPSAASSAPFATSTPEAPTAQPTLGTAVAATASFATIGKPLKAPRKPHRRTPR